MPSKKPVELTPAQLKRFELCYGVYRKKAQRGQDEITWAKYDFDDEMTNKIYQAIIAQNRADKGQTNKKFLRSFSRWMNEKGWLDIIEPEEKNEPTKEIKNLNIPEQENCWKKKLREDFDKRNGLLQQEDETTSQWFKRLSEARNQYTKRFSRNINRGQETKADFGKSLMRKVNQMCNFMKDLPSHLVDKLTPEQKRYISNQLNNAGDKLK